MKLEELPASLSDAGMISFNFSKFFQQSHKGTLIDRQVTVKAAAQVTVYKANIALRRARRPQIRPNVAD